MKQNQKNDIRILRAISGGARTSADLKKAMRRDVRKDVNLLRKDGSVDQIDGEFILTRRGAGRLRFAS